MVVIDKCRRDCYNVYRTPPKQIAYPRQETPLVKPQNPSKAAAEAAAEAAAAAETVVAETVVASPKTAEAAVIAAIAAIVSGAGYMAAKKH